MKKIINATLIVILVLALGACARNVSQDANKFKKEYEGENNKTLGGREIRKLSIPSDNPFVYKTSKDIVEGINNKESFIVYFGFSTCPWCRSVLPSLIEVAKDNNIKEIYYVDVKDIRDRLSYDNSAKKVVIEDEGDKEYLELLGLLADVLDDYSLTDENGKTIKTGKKRIYAPNIIVVEKGEAKEKVTGISELLADPYMEITEDVEKDIKAIFNNLFASDVCSPSGC